MVGQCRIITRNPLPFRKSIVIIPHGVFFFVLQLFFSIVVTITAAMDDVVIRRMFVVPSFEIHGGVSGLYDLGPPGCGLKGNVVSLWKQHFILAEGMLEMECTNLTPENVLQTSGTYVHGCIPVHRFDGARGIPALR